MHLKLVTDSSSDLRDFPSIDFAVTPLKIITSQKEYVDDAALDISQMVNDLSTYKGRSSTSCPNVGDWLSAFADAENIICVTITGTLSGSYNSAQMAKEAYEEQHPGRRVFVLDSLSTGPEMQLILEKAKELAESGLDFDSICAALTEYREKTGLLFMLESMKNLANNGRVSPLIAKMAGLLGIRVVGKASDRGDLEPLHKCRGEKKALDALVSQMHEAGLSGGNVRISHCFSESAARELKSLLKQKFGSIPVEIRPCAGLCSFYAENGGLLVGFEKF